MRAALAASGQVHRQASAVTVTTVRNPGPDRVVDVPLRCRGRVGGRRLRGRAIGRVAVQHSVSAGASPVHPVGLSLHALPRPLLPMSRLSRVVLCRFAVLLLPILCAADAAAAVQVELGAGVSLTRGNEDTPVATVAWLPEWRGFRGGTLRWEVGAMHLRGRSDSHYDNDDDVTIVHGGLRYERPSGLVAGFGVGVQEGWTEALSGDPQFISTLGWRWGRFSLLARHVSN